MALPWRDRRSRTDLRVTTRPGGLPGHVRLKTYRDAILDYRWHPEAKSGDPSGGSGTRRSAGLLPRLRVEAAGVRHIGKESNRLDEEEAAMLGEGDEPYVEYGNERRGDWERALPMLRKLRGEHGWHYLAEVSGLSERAVRYALNGNRVPHALARRRIVEALVPPSWP